MRLIFDCILKTSVKLFFTLVFFNSYFSFAQSDSIIFFNEIERPLIKHNHSVFFSPLYTVPMYFKPSYKSTDIKLRGRVNFNLGYCYTNAINTTSTLNISTAFERNSIALVQKKFINGITNNSSEKEINNNGELKYVKSNTLYYRNNNSIYFTKKIAKATNLIYGVSFDFTMIQGYSRSSNHDQFKANLTQFTDQSVHFIPSLIIGTNLLNLKNNQKFRFSIIYKQDIAKSSLLISNYNVRNTLYKSAISPYLNTLGLNFSYTIFQSKMANKEQKNNINELRKKRNVSFKIEPSLLLIHYPFTVNNFRRVYSNALLSQLNGVLKHNKFDFGCGFMQKNILKSSAQDTLSSWILMQKNYFGLSLFLRKNIILKNNSNFHFQYSSLISRILTKNSPKYGIISNDIYSLKDYHHVFSVGKSQSISEKIKFGWNAGLSFSDIFENDIAGIGVAGGIFVSFF